jgi:hypothetical protein
LPGPQGFGNTKLGLSYCTVAKSGIHADLPQSIGYVFGDKRVSGFEDALCGAGVT